MIFKNKLILIMLLILILPCCKFLPHAGISNEWGGFEAQIGITITHDF